MNPELLEAVLRFRIRMFLGLLYPDPLVRGSGSVKPGAYDMVWLYV
jgi:hypothetical protein